MTEPAPVDPLAGFAFPSHWAEEALEAVRETLRVRPELEGPELVALEQAAELVTTAARLEEIARAADFVAVGSAGQLALHPAVTEARLSRTQAAGIMHKLTRVAAGPKMTNSERARAAAQARWQNAPGRGGRK